MAAIPGDGGCVPSIIGVGASMILSPPKFVSTLSRLFVFAVPAKGTYSPPKTLLLDLTGPLGGEEKATWREERRRKGEKEEWSCN